MRLVPRSVGVRQSPHQCQYCLRQFFSPHKMTGRPRLYCSTQCRQDASRKCFVATNYIDLKCDKTTQKTAATSATSKVDFADRPWRQIAGPPLDAAAIHCATLGGAEAVATVNQTNLKFWREVQ